MTIDVQNPAVSKAPPTAERPYTGLLLTENQLFQLFITMDVVKSSNLDLDGERYLPRDLVYDTPYGLGYELGQSILDRLSDADEPATELEMVIEDFQALHLGLQCMLDDFNRLKRSRSAMTKPEPSEDAPANAWDEYEESLRYRMP